MLNRDLQGSSPRKEYKFKSIWGFVLKHGIRCCERYRITFLNINIYGCRIFKSALWYYYKFHSSTNPDMVSIYDRPVFSHKWMRVLQILNIGTNFQYKSRLCLMQFFLRAFQFVKTKENKQITVWLFIIFSTNEKCQIIFKFFMNIEFLKRLTHSYTETIYFASVKFNDFY